MPSPIASTVPVQATDILDHPYRSETSYKKFAEFLNKPVTLADCQGRYSEPFTLRDLLQALKVQQAYLKGSCVQQLGSKTVAPDIDIQFRPPAQSHLATPKELKSALEEFIATRQGSAETVPKQWSGAWISKFSHDMNAAWSRTIVSLGYPKTGASTIDLNCSTSKVVCHDTIAASKAIEFDLAQKRSFSVDAWSPVLVDWMRKSDLLWFNPDIDNGLSRLSYRLCKKPESRLLQPGLATYFCDKASPETVSNIYFRVLAGEYPRSALEPTARAELWFSALKAMEKHGHATLEQQLLSWTRYSSLGELQAALHDSDSLPITLRRLQNACRVVADTRTALRELLGLQHELKNTLREHIECALGPHDITGAELFRLLDQFEHMDDVPERELLHTLGDSLQRIQAGDDPTLQARARHLTGHLNHNLGSTFRFQMERIPENSRSSPSDKALSPAIDTAVELITQGQISEFAQAVHQLSELRLSMAQWEKLMPMWCLHAQPIASAGESLGDWHPAFDLFTVLKKHDAVLLKAQHEPTCLDWDGMEPKALDSFRTDFLAFHATLGKTHIPRALSAVLQRKSGMLNFVTPKLRIQINPQANQVTLCVDDTVRQFSEQVHTLHCRDTDTNDGVWEIKWQDGSRFDGKQKADSSIVEGHLTAPRLVSRNTDFENLVRTGRRLCEMVWPRIPTESNLLIASGHFNADPLGKAVDLDTAAQALHKGKLLDHGRQSGVCIETTFEKGQPTLCLARQQGTTRSQELRMLFSSNVDDSTPIKLFEGAWQVRPRIGCVEVRQSVWTPGVVHQVGMLLSPWDWENNQLSGSGHAMFLGQSSLNWTGQIYKGRLLPVGALSMHGQSRPVLEFDGRHGLEPIPLELLPVMADLLGPKMRGEYVFKPEVLPNNQGWPAQGVEGFVHELPVEHGCFSGYITGTGRAMGVVNLSAEKRSNTHYVVLKGNFLVCNTHVLHQSLGFEGKASEQAQFDLGNGRMLVPHGQCREHVIDRASRNCRVTIQQLFFQGHSFTCGVLTQPDIINYDAPLNPLYFAGLHSAQIDLVFELGDGADDFLQVLPVDHNALSDYSKRYYDASGFKAKLLVTQNRVRLGELHFPSGLVYKGELGVHGNRLHLLGSGVLQWKNLKISGRFRPDKTVQQLKAGNTDTARWMEERFSDMAQNTDLNALLGSMTNQALTCGVHMDPHLLDRDLSHLKKKAIVFKSR